MPTIQQLIRTERSRLKAKTKSPALKSCPERRGVCTRVYHLNAQKAEFGAAQGGSCAPDLRL